MLSSPKEEQQFDVTKDLSAPSSAGRFDNILGSIRHLTEDINLKEIAAAYTNANQLVEKLLSLEKQLLTLNEIKRRLGGVNGAKSEAESSLHDPLRIHSQGTRVPKLIPFPGTTKPATPVGTAEAEVSTAKKPPLAEPKQTAASEPNPPLEQQKSIAKPAVVSDQPINLPSRPAPLPVEEKESASDFASTDYLVPFSAKPKEAPKSRVVEREFPVWEKNPLAMESQEVAVLEPTLPAQTNARAMGSEFPQVEPRTSQRISHTKTQAKDKSKYQVTYSFGDKKANFDQRLRELVKTYGEVDIYSNQDTYNKKRNLKKTAIAAFVLVLAFAAFPGGGSFLTNTQRGQSSRPDSLPPSQPTAPTTSALVTTVVPLAEMDAVPPVTKSIPMPAKQRKLPRKTEQGSLANPSEDPRAPAKTEEKKRQETTQPLTTGSQPSATGSQQ